MDKMLKASVGRKVMVSGTLGRQHAAPSTSRWSLSWTTLHTLSYKLRYRPHADIRPDGTLRR